MRNWGPEQHLRISSCFLFTYILLEPNNNLVASSHYLISGNSCMALLAGRAGGGDCLNHPLCHSHSVQAELCTPRRFCAWAGGAVHHRIAPKSTAVRGVFLRCMVPKLAASSHTCSLHQLLSDGTQLHFQIAFLQSVPVVCLKC